MNGEALKTNGPDGQSPDGPATTHVKDSPSTTLPASAPAKSQQSSAMSAEPTHFGQAYSERNPAPNIQGLREHDQARQEASRRYFDETHSEPTEPSRPEEKEDTTGHEEPTKSDDDGAKAGATGDVPIGAEKSNVLFQPTPQVDFDQVFKTLHEDALQVSYVVAGSILVLDWLFIGGGFKGLLKSLLPAIGVATGVFYILSGVGQQAADRKVEQAEPKMEKLRYVPESSARILSMRSLPDSEFGELVPTHGLNKSGSSKEAEEREKAVEREEGGVFYNLEIAVAYHEAPFRSRKEQMHVDVLAAIGPVPLPIFVQVKEFVATIRIRLQMHPDLPFLKNLTFALTESPKINTSVSLGAPWALDLLNLPIIDSVLASQIDQAAADFVQPKSMSLDMTAYVGGSDQMEETEAIGVLFVKIHRARNLARQDTRGPGADPYLTIAFSKYEKPMYATRIIKGDRNPLILNANKMQKREDKLQGDVAGTDAEGVLEWEIGYFPRAEFEKALRTDAMDPRDHHGDTVEVADEDKTQNAQNTVPDPNLPSGILGLTIHQCINVQVDNPGKKSMGNVKTRRQDSDGELSDSEETINVDYIPSLYVSADINDLLIYRTRVKSITSAPTFNSNTETYIRDWRLASLTLSVWDTRKNTDDCLVGVASLKLSEIFNKSSSVVKFYDLKGGAGTGRIRVSMIFRSMRMKLEESLLGFTVGSFVFSSPILCTGDMYTHKLRLRSSATTRIIKNGTKSDGGYTWKLEDSQNILPVHFRYMGAIVFEFIGIGLTEKLKGPLGKNKHYAVLWLFKLIDNKEEHFSLPIYHTNNPNRLTQNVVDESDDTMELKEVGRVKFSGKFKAGLDEAHGEFQKDHDHWSTYQSWLAARKSGQRQAQTNRTTNELNDQLAKGITKSQSIHV
ncbi:Meiotically up-regulated protein [Lachnellula willkommii]|uniref:Meiotically up-regulated protein n=1 Tax=Lachnellula willkommii TaxID=215461 RepID=A0A559MLK7_9HELO|nr:Meiotically up-regulated protein [Lachnellula willkommii]